MHPQLSLSFDSNMADASSMLSSVQGVPSTDFSGTLTLLSDEAPAFVLLPHQAQSTCLDTLLFSLFENSSSLSSPDFPPRDLFLSTPRQSPTHIAVVWTPTSFVTAPPTVCQHRIPLCACKLFFSHLFQFLKPTGPAL